MARKLNDSLADSPTVWFVQLEVAIRIGDRDLEERARAELARRGVAVWINQAVMLAAGGEGSDHG